MNEQETAVILREELRILREIRESQTRWSNRVWDGLMKGCVAAVGAIIVWMLAVQDEIGVLDSRLTMAERTMFTAAQAEAMRSAMTERILLELGGVNDKLATIIAKVAELERVRDRGEQDH